MASQTTKELHNNFIDFLIQDQLVGGTGGNPEEFRASFFYLLYKNANIYALNPLKTPIKLKDFITNKLQLFSDDIYDKFIDFLYNTESINGNTKLSMPSDFGISTDPKYPLIKKLFPNNFTFFHFINTNFFKSRPSPSFKACIYRPGQGKKVSCHNRIRNSHPM